MEPFKIVGLSIAAAVAYGLVHDQFTAHLCVEYFSFGHPPLFGTEDSADFAWAETQFRGE